MSDLATNPILMIGATARPGIYTTYLVERLRDEGRAVRVLAPSRSRDADALAVLGAEVVDGDLSDRRSMVSALADIDLVYFGYPITTEVVSAAVNYASAVRAVGRNPRTVVMSSSSAHPEHPSRLGQEQWLAEEALQWAGLRLLVLRVGAACVEDLSVLHGISIRNEGVIRSSFGGSSVGWISRRDLAELGVAALLHPDRFEAPVTYLPGAEQFDYTYVAEALSALLNKPVSYEPVSPEQWYEELVSSSHERTAILTNTLAQHVSSIGDMSSQRGSMAAADAATLRRFIGRNPLTLHEALEATFPAFTAPGVAGANVE